MAATPSCTSDTKSRPGTSAMLHTKSANCFELELTYNSSSACDAAQRHASAHLPPQSRNANPVHALHTRRNITNHIVKSLKLLTHVKLMTLAS